MGYCAQQHSLQGSVVSYPILLRLLGGAMESSYIPPCPLASASSSNLMPSSNFVAWGAVLLTPDSSLSRSIAWPLTTHQFRTSLMAFLISLPFNSHFANSVKSCSDSCLLVSPFGRRVNNFSHSCYREFDERLLKSKWMCTRDRKAISIVEKRFVVKKTEFPPLVLRNAEERKQFRGATY
jgi:hypothetical protein